MSDAEIAPPHRADDRVTAPELPASPHTDDDLARRLRGFGPVGIAAVLVVLAGNLIVGPLSAVFALMWAKRSGTPFRELGFVRPNRWWRMILVGTVFGVVFKLVMKAIVMPLLGAAPINPTYHYLEGNPVAALLAIPQMIVIAGFGEETLFRGYMFERLGKLLGRGIWATVAIVIFTSVLFGSLHYHDQGLPGAQQATIVGLVYGTIYARTRRLGMLMVAHAAFDIAAVAIIYWRLESAVAHSIFK